MAKYLDFEKEEKGYEPFQITRENIRANIGKIICYVDRVDSYRGYYSVHYGKIHSIRYSILYLDDMDKEVDIRDIKEAGIKIDSPNN